MLVQPNTVDEKTKRRPKQNDTIVRWKIESGVINDISLQSNPSAKDTRKGETGRSRGMEVGAISGSRSDHASVANQSLSRLVKNHRYIYIYMVAITVPCSPPASKHPFTLYLNAAKISYYTVKIRRKLESRGFNRESGVNYRFDTSSWTTLLDRLSIKGFHPMHLVSLGFLSFRRARLSIREESGYFLAMRGIASNAGN